MSTHRGVLRALSGLPLAEGELSRFIYMDEAGTAPSEPVRVVAAIIVHGDRELRWLTSEIDRIVSARVPEQFQSGFHFHATEVFNGGRMRNFWEFEDRLDFLKEILCLPFANDIPIAVGTCFAGTVPLDDEAKRLKAKVHYLEHLFAFQFCAERSDLFLRKYLDGAEVGTIVAEDLPKTKRFLKEYGLIYRKNPQTISKGDLHPNWWQKILRDTAQGRNAVQDIELSIQHIVDVPHFVEKKYAPLLQLADACAFTFRRFLSKQERAEELIYAMLGPEQGLHVIRDPAWRNANSAELFNTQKYWTEEQRQRSRMNYHFVTRVGSHP